MDPLPSSSSPAALDAPLTDAEYDRLEALLDLDVRADAMDLEEMDGFFAALICGPETVLPSVYLNEIWGGEEAPFATEAEFEDFLNLSMRHWNSIAALLATPDQIFMPWLVTEEGEELPRGNRWARGFLRAVGLCRDAWNEVFKDDDKFAMLLPVLALAHEDDPDIEMRTWKTPPAPEMRTNVIIGLSAAVRRLYDYFLSRRTRAPRSVRASGPKIGRNDPCLCGSGKKYKRCCGDVTIH